MNRSIEELKLDVINLIHICEWLGASQTSLVFARRALVSNRAFTVQDARLGLIALSNVLKGGE